MSYNTYLSPLITDGYSVSKYIKLYTSFILENIFAVGMLCNVWDNKQNIS